MPNITCRYCSFVGFCHIGFIKAQSFIGSLSYDYQLFYVGTISVHGKLHVHVQASPVYEICRLLSVDNLRASEPVSEACKPCEAGSLTSKWLNAS